MFGTRTRRAQDDLVIHEDANDHLTKRQRMMEDAMDESRDGLEESAATRATFTDSEEEEEEVEAGVAEDMARLEKSFKGISSKYRLINRIGEGTFSTVYKAEDLLYETYENKWDFEEKENHGYRASGKTAKPRKRPHYVAIKKIYVTSSPQRIMNELDLLHDLRHSDTVCPLITAFRDRDQVVAILPYFRHLDFRHYYREMNVADMRIYFRSLFSALAAVHEKKILHRDIKPTNFLYDTERKQGVLVDFGLAERLGTDHQPCVCQLSSDARHQRYSASTHGRSVANGSSDSYVGQPKNDTRPSLRANRAGTRGFRAPEVLFKCTAQTTKIDIWSAGVILLTIQARRFPFFNSSDDIEAVIELCTVFGKQKMKKTALLHGQVLDTNIPTLNETGHSLEKIIIWSTRQITTDKYGNKIRLKPDELEATDFLGGCLEMDPSKRFSAVEALAHPFLNRPDDEGSADEMDPIGMSSPAD